MDRHDASMAVSELRDALLESIDYLREGQADRPTFPLNADEWEVQHSEMRTPPDDRTWWLIDWRVVAHVVPHGSPLRDTTTFLWARKREETA